MSNMEFFLSVLAPIVAAIVIAIIRPKPSLNLPAIFWKMLSISFFTIAILIVVSAIYALYLDIAGHGPRTVAVVPTKKAIGPEVKIDLVPGLMTFGGHKDVIFLPPCKFNIVLITKTIAVSCVTGNKVLIHFGPYNKGIAKIPTLVAGKKRLVNGVDFGLVGIKIALLVEGTEVHFPDGEKPMIWFSAEKGKNEELVFHKGDSGKVVFSYKKLDYQ